MFETSNDFTADQFTATQWEGADQKAKFARQFIAFVESDFAKDKFPVWFYRRLSMTFGHIAHFNQHGFFETFFTSTEDKVKFLRQTVRHTCYGDPAWTYSDVEKALKKWVMENAVLFKHENRLADEHEAAERAELARLKGKYATKGA